MIVRKDIFRPGTYHLPDGRKMTFTNKDVLNAHANGLAMLRNSFSVPTIYEHDENAMPVPLSNAQAKPDWPESFARKAVGYVTGFGVKYENRVPVLWTEHEIPDPKDAEQWKKARFASPYIHWDAKDSKGNTYPGASVSHVAITPRPIQIEQRPVQLSTTGYTAPVFLSMEYLKMADENDDKGGSGDGASGGEFSRIKDALSSMGHTLPDSVMDWGGLATALEVLAANGGDSSPMDDMDEDEMGGDMAQTAPANPPVMMSAQQMKINERLVAAERRALTERAEKATRVLVSRAMLTSDQARKFVGRFNSVNLSFAADGNLSRNDAITQLETYEQLAGNVRRTKAPVNLSGTVAMAAPDIGQRDPKTVEERQQAATAMIMDRVNGVKK